MVSRQKRKREYDNFKTVEEYQQFLEGDQGKKLGKKERQAVQSRMGRKKRNARFRELEAEKDRSDQENELIKAENKKLRALLALHPPTCPSTATHVASSPGHLHTIRPIGHSSCIATLLTNGEVAMNAFLRDRAKIFPLGYFKVVSDCAITVRSPADKEFNRYLMVDQGDPRTVLLNLALGFFDILSQVNIGMTDWAFTAIENEIEGFCLGERDRGSVLKLCSTGQQVYKRLTDDEGDPNLEIGDLGSCSYLPVEYLRDIGVIFAKTFVQRYGLFEI
ncbi:hypothetical protein TWF718_009673 [Orbilia javanica]|uniref:Uncharacterized protein n=1 Tax=Orbilia javanica TaxID=47235 RepID=A0AAN8MJA3_9PEZI